MRVFCGSALFSRGGCERSWLLSWESSRGEESFLPERSPAALPAAPTGSGSAIPRAQLLQGWSYTRLPNLTLWVTFSCFIYCFSGAISWDLYLTLLCWAWAAVQVNLRWYRCGQIQNVGTDLLVVGIHCVSSCGDSSRVLFHNRTPWCLQKWPVLSPTLTKWRVWE